MTHDLPTAGGTLAVLPAAGLPVEVPGPLVGVDLGIGDELDCEGDLRALRAALEASGLAEEMWITTHAVGRQPDRHVAFVVALPAAGDGVLGEQSAFDAVRSAFTGWQLPAQSQAPFDPHGHTHARYAPAIACGQLAEGGREPLAGAYEALASRAAGFGGRAVVFPGDTRLVGEVSVAEILSTAVEDVVDLARTEVGARDRVCTRDFVRPRLQDGRWVLVVQPAVGGTFVPFEEPNPHRCCEDH